MDIKLNPIVQWVGGKGRLLENIHSHLPETMNTYHELFLGGGSLLLSLKPKLAHCYELNKHLCIVYNVIKNNPEELVQLLFTLEKEYLSLETKEERKAYYIDIRNKFNEEDNEIKIAAYLKFLNKTCFNALYRVNLKGKFNVPFGTGRDPTVCDKENIMNLSTYLNENDIHIMNKDFETSIQNMKKGDFVYIDPPYYPLKENSFTGYTVNGFQKEDHERLILFCKKLTEMGVQFILSNSNCDYIKNSFQEDNYSIYELSVARTLNSKKNKRSKSKCEIIVKNF